jgi:hypothetical protein
VSKAQAPNRVTVGDPSAPICTDDVCSIPGLPEYGGPTARDSSAQQPPEAEEFRLLANELAHRESLDLT